MSSLWSVCYRGLADAYLQSAWVVQYVGIHLSKCVLRFSPPVWLPSTILVVNANLSEKHPF